MPLLDAQTELPEPVRKAVAVLSTGAQRQDDTLAQIQDVLILAMAARYSAISVLISKDYPEIPLDEPSGKDPRITVAAKFLRSVADSPDKDQGWLLRKLTIAAGCYDAYDRLKATTLSQFWP